MTSDQPEAGIVAPEADETARPSSNRRRNLLLVLVGVIVVDILAYLIVPPFPAGGQPGDECGFPVCFINGTLELPAPHVVFDLDTNPKATLSGDKVKCCWDPTIPSTVVTLWIIAALLLSVAFVATRGMKSVPGRLQNLVEFGYESLQNFAVGLGGARAIPYVPFYAAFFLLILFSNWSGLVPPVGRVEFLRAPTSDVNVTIGLALVSFGYFEFQGFRAHGVIGYMSKFFPVYEFRNGIGAGLIAMFVGLIELMLEFVKPLTLSMRLFGNIYGGEVALGVMTALTLAIVPVALVGLEVILNFVQALIFSVLTLMFILIAIESHGHEEGEMAEEAVAAIEGHGPEAAPAH